MPRYHVNYSVQSSPGATAIGRCFYTGHSLDSEDNILTAEKFILDDLCKTQPTAKNLFFTWWAKIKADDSSKSTEPKE